MVSAFASDYEGMYAKFRAWEETYWKDYVEGPLNITAAETMKTLITEFEEKRRKHTVKSGGVYRERAEAVKDAPSPLNLTKYATETSDGMKMFDSVAKKYGIRVYTVGIGHTGDFDPISLKQIADETKGKFYQATSKEELQNIYKQIDYLEKSRIKTEQLVKKTYLYQYPLDVAIGLLFILLLINRKNS
jgi:hypothetical protein